MSVVPSASVRGAAVDGSGRPAAAAGAGLRLRHGFFAAALLVVSGLRLAEHDLVWASVLGAAGAVEAGLAVASARTRRAHREQARPAPAPGAGLPDGTVLERSLRAHRRNERLWLASLCATTGSAALVLLDAPAIAAVLGLTALLCLARLRRERRSVATLMRLTDPGASPDRRQA